MSLKLIKKYGAIFGRIATYLLDRAETF
jgi:hypothetical protein